MRLIHVLTTAALLALPTIALAQAAGADQPGAAPATSTGSYGAGESTASGAGSAGAVAATVTTGLPVKDKTGATIGSVADVKTDASGKKVATIRMGADTFAVDTSALAVDSGAAVINATQAEIKSMLPKGK